MSETPVVPAHVLPTTPMGRLLCDLLARAPKMQNGDGSIDETQTPAMKCQVMLRGGGQIAGILAPMHSGMLKMLIVGPSSKDSKVPAAVEAYFMPEDLLTVVVDVDIKPQMKSNLII